MENQKEGFGKHFILDLRTSFKKTTPIDSQRLKECEKFKAQGGDMVKAIKQNLSQDKILQEYKVIIYFIENCGLSAFFDIST